MYGPVKGQRERWTILLALERYRHHLCPYLLWNTCLFVTMSKCSIVHLFLIQHGFSNYFLYCRSFVIAVVCICVCGGGGGGSACLRQVTKTKKLALKPNVFAFISQFL